MGVLGSGDQVVAAEVLVEVGAADAAELGGDFDVVRLGDGGDGDAFESDVLLAVEADGVHGGDGAVGGLRYGGGDGHGEVGCRAKMLLVGDA